MYSVTKMMMLMVNGYQREQKYLHVAIFPVWIWQSKASWKETIISMIITMMKMMRWRTISNIFCSWSLTTRSCLRENQKRSLQEKVINFVILILSNPPTSSLFSFSYNMFYKWKCKSSSGPEKQSCVCRHPRLAGVTTSPSFPFTSFCILPFPFPMFLVHAFFIMLSSFPYWYMQNYKIMFLTLRRFENLPLIWFDEVDWRPS